MCAALGALVEGLAGVTPAHLTALLVGLVAVRTGLAARGEGGASRCITLAQLVAVLVRGKAVRAF